MLLHVVLQISSGIVLIGYLDFHLKKEQVDVSRAGLESDANIILRIKAKHGERGLLDALKAMNATAGVYGTRAVIYDGQGRTSGSAPWCPCRSAGGARWLRRSVDGVDYGLLNVALADGRWLTI